MVQVSQCCPIDPAAVRGPSALLASAAAGFARLLRCPATWIARQRARSELAGFDDRALRDMGVTRYDINAEARKPFWQD